MIGAPTYEVALFYPLAHLLDIAIHKGLRNRKAAFFGSYGWVGGAVKNLERIIEPAQWNLIDSLEFVGGPTKENLRKGEEFGAKFAEIIKNAWSLRGPNNLCGYREQCSFSGVAQIP